MLKIRSLDVAYGGLKALSDVSLDVEEGQLVAVGDILTSEEARREHYLKLLAHKLKDPEFRKIEGFDD